MRIPFLRRKRTRKQRWGDVLLEMMEKWAKQK
jgi:hypothetical protein